MKFGETLKSSLIKDYAYYYIRYDELKYTLKKGLESNNNQWNDTLEEQFVDTLEQELDKVYNFFRLKHKEILRRVKEVETLVERTVQASKNAVDIEDLQYFEQDFQDLEEELSDIIADVHDLNTFTRLNYIGFQKILKKHDKLTKFILKPIFQARLNSKSFIKDNLDALIVKLSKLYDLVRTKGNPVKGDSSAGGKMQNFVRQTTKYWVHPDNITELKLIILKHLPVLVFNPNKEFETEDSAISSIYFDDKEMDLYYGRLLKTEGAEAIRIRWYGGMSTETCFIERKTHREDWTGEKSVKARFPIKESKVNDFLHGKFTAKQLFEKARKEGKKSTQEIDSLERLAQEVQYRVLKDKMRPVMRTFYNRTAFQLPGDARVRISLDTELTMVREDNFDGVDRTHGNWRRMDIGVDFPFSQLPESDAERFPYAVLEVKLQTQMGQEPPQWVRDMVSSHLVEAVPKFSKFIHGSATLLPDMVTLVPFWMPQMDVDIRKPKQDASYGIISKHRLLESAGNSLDEEELAGNSSSLIPTNGNNTYGSVSINESNNRTEGSSTNSTNEGALAPLVNWYKNLVRPDHSFNKVPIGTVFESTFRAPPGKKIAVPVRVEPKVYFATERTFLSWLSISLIFGATAHTLMNYGDITSLLTAACFYLTAVLTILYSSGVYIFRVINIRNKRAVRYDDQWGPRLVCIALALSVGVSFIFRYLK
ncbi:vacuolar transporter chaperone [Pichia californica]|uniref:Vacuolar transporter chaperone complex subunit 4 n=1 Tax=Pichia californica TaxID=460514 RepID=A0A9P6WIZ7_9ASCO|nr:vacuolar transporter chaperone [[Candida] californica]KAG0686938.1 vacuolar transporter chaperone [[Candida] californica]